MKLNKGGLKLCAVYFCYFVLMSIPELITSNPKGAVFFGLLSVAPCVLVFMLLASLGLGDVLMYVIPYESWLNSGLFTVPVSFVVVYLIGWAMSALARAAKALKPDTSMPVVDPPGWSDRR